MQNAKAGLSTPADRSHKPILVAGILVILVALIIYGLTTFRGGQTAPPPPPITTITQSELAEKYGLSVQLVAVTAAGGLIDVRLQIINSAKAKAFLSDQANFPTLHVGNDVVLRASEDIAAQTIEYKNGSSIFALYPNALDVVHTGDPVTIVFGDSQLEAIQAK
mgnify:CR=1 FL=1